jgi:hypothetical protein
MYINRIFGYLELQPLKKFLLIFQYAGSPNLSL